MKKVLVLRPRFLGDLVLATGLPGVIRRAHPGAEVWFLTESRYAPVLQAHPDVAGVLELDPARKNSPAHLWGLLREVRRQKFDTVLDLFGNPRTARTSFFSGAATRVGYRLRGRRWAYNVIAAPSSGPSPSGRRKVTEAYLDQVRALGINADEEYRTSLVTTPEEKGHAGKILGRAKLRPGEKVAVLSPGASWPAKRWPLDRFVELAGRLMEAGLRPLFILGPKEEGIAKELEPRMEAGWLLIDQPSLRGLVALIEAADLLVANDAGPMHVGPAVGTPTLGLFGPGEPEIWFPYQAPHEFGYVEVPCAHCGLEQCPLMACMDRLDVDSVAAKALRVVSGKAKKQ